MAFKLGELFWKIKGETSDFDKKAKGTEKTAQGMGKTFSKVGSLITGTFVLAIVAGIGKISKELIKSASEAEEVSNKFNVTFSTIKDEADATAKSLADSYGVSRTAAKELLAGTGDLLAGFGFSQNAALDLSTTVNQLAGDLASFQNVDIKQASDAITKGLLGEREALKGLGIAITEADIKQLAEDKGIVGELDRQTKANLTLELALRQSGNAIGDFERSQNSFANQTRIAQANVQNLKDSLGVGLLPFANAGVMIFNQFAKELQVLADSMQAFVGTAEGADKISKIVGFLSGALVAFKEVAGSAFGEIIEAIQILLEPLQDLLGDAAETVDIFEVMGKVFQILGGYIKVVGGLWQVLGTYLSGVIKFWIKYVDIFIKGGKLIIDTAKAIVNPFDADARAKAKASAMEFAGSFVEAGKQVIKTFVDTGKRVGTEVTDFVGDVEDAAGDYEEAFLEANKNIAKATSDNLIAIAQSNAEKNKIIEEQEKRKAEQDKKREEQKRKDFLKIQEEYQDRILELTGTEREKLEAKYQEDLELAQKAGEDTLEIEKYYKEQREKLSEEEKEAKIQAIQDQLKTYSGYVGQVGDMFGALIESQIAGDQKLTAEKRNGLLVLYRLQQASALAQVAIDTASAIQRQFSDLPIYAAIASSAVIAANAGIQTGVILSTPPPFNSGGIVPGQPSFSDTQQAALTPGEEVITRDDPRHRFNGGGGSKEIVIRFEPRIFADIVVDDFINTGIKTIEARAIR